MMAGEHLFRPGHAPTPFTAAEIRDGCPEGRRVVVRHETGHSIQFQATTFTGCDVLGTELAVQQVDLDGSPVGEEERFRVSWADLQSHSSFPVETATISEERITTPLGDQLCLLYSVADGVTAKKLWFAIDRPGLPVQTQELIDGTKIRSSIMSDSQ